MFSGSHVEKIIDQPAAIFRIWAAGNQRYRVGNDKGPHLLGMLIQKTDLNRCASIYSRTSIIRIGQAKPEFTRRHLIPNH